MRSMSRFAWVKDIAALISLVSFMWMMGTWVELARSLVS